MYFEKASLVGFGLQAQCGPVTVVSLNSVCKVHCIASGRDGERWQQAPWLDLAINLEMALLWQLSQSLPEKTYSGE